MSVYTEFSFKMRTAGLTLLMLILAAGGASAYAAAPVKLMVNQVTGGNSNWVLFSDDTRQWLNSDCADQLIAANLEVSLTNWAEISRYPAGTWMSCSDIFDELNESGSGSNNTATLLLNGPDAVDGWIRYADDTRQWVSGTCVLELQNLGIPQTVTDWAQISSYAVGEPRTCAAIRTLISNTSGGSNNGSSGGGSSGGGSSGGAGTSLSLLFNGANVNSNTSVFVRFGDGTRQWVDASCRTRLRNAGVTEVITDWSVIGALSEGPWRSCDEIAKLVDGGVTGGANPYNYPPMPTFTRNCIGMNDDFAFSWDGGSLVADAFKQSRGPLIDDFITLSQRDADEWPVGNQFVNFVLGDGEHGLEKFNPWVLLPYDQGGVWLNEPLEDVWDLEGAEHVGFVDYSGVIGHEFNLTTDDINFRIAPSSIPESPRNRWHLIPKSMAQHYAKAMLEQNFEYIFNDDTYARDLNFPLLHTNAKTQLADFCRIRFMLGDQVNSLQFSGFARDRTTPRDPTFNTAGGDGISYEWQVWIANHLDINAYHVDHVKTWDAWDVGDRYLNDEADYYARYLRGNVIREYGNEIWNTAGPFLRQTLWVIQHRPYSIADPVTWDLFNHKYAKRSWDTAGAWDTAFAGRRQDLDLTVGIQMGCPTCADDRVTSPDGVSFGDRIDSISGTFYIGSPVVPGEPLYDRVLNLGTSEVAAAHQASVEKLKADFAIVRSESAPHVSKWHMYEGGSHMDFPAYNPRNADHVKVANSIRNYWNSYTFTQTLNSFTNWWSQLPGSGELMWFNLYGLDSPDNPWGYYRDAADTTTEYYGVRLFMQNYPW